MTSTQLTAWLMVLLIVVVVAGVWLAIDVGE